MINSDVVNLLVILINIFKKKDGIYYINIKQKTIVIHEGKEIYMALI